MPRSPTERAISTERVRRPRRGSDSAIFDVETWHFQKYGIGL